MANGGSIGRRHGGAALVPDGEPDDAVRDRRRCGHVALADRDVVAEQHTSPWKRPVGVNVMADGASPGRQRGLAGDGGDAGAEPVVRPVQAAVLEVQGVAAGRPAVGHDDAIGPALGDVERRR